MFDKMKLPGTKSVPKMTVLAPLARLLDKQPSIDSSQSYLLGLRGLLAIECFIWAFLQTFVPASVKDSQQTSAPLYQVILRKTISVLFWNDSLLYSFFILLSARTICIPFIKNPTKISVASAVFRRGIRLWFPVAVALAVVKLTFSQTGFQYIWDFKTQTSNITIQTPYNIPSTLAYFNSVFNLFWTTSDFARQAGSKAFPTQTLWILNAIYSQSYTVYMTMVIIPYTRNRWRVQAFMIFIATAWWVQSWAWYSITGLLLADAVMNMEFKKKAQHGIHVFRSIRCPSWVPSVLLLLGGLVMQYLWTAWRPEYSNAELRAHTGLYYTGGLNNHYDPTQPQARDDNYLVILGFFLLLESFDFLQFVFSNKFFLYLGRRSLSMPTTPY